MELSLHNTCGELLGAVCDVPITSVSRNDSSTLEINELISKFRNFNPVKPVEPPKIDMWLKIGHGRKVQVQSDWTLAKVLSIYLIKSKDELPVKDLTLILGDSSGVTELIRPEELEKIESFMPSSPLDEFVKCGGLTVLADRLPVLIPFIHEPLLSITDKDRLHANNQSMNSKTSPDFVDYVIMNESDEPFIDDIYNDMPMNNNASAAAAAAAVQTNKLKKISMPLHAFIAFGLFLKIPGYANVI